MVLGTLELIPPGDDLDTVPHRVQGSSHRFEVGRPPSLQRHEREDADLVRNPQQLEDGRFVLQTCRTLLVELVFQAAIFVTSSSLNRNAVVIT
jgi:hypothetical protein